MKTELRKMTEMNGCSVASLVVAKYRYSIDIIDILTYIENIDMWFPYRNNIDIFFLEKKSFVAVCRAMKKLKPNYSNREINGEMETENYQSSNYQKLIDTNFSYQFSVITSL